MQAPRIAVATTTPVITPILTPIATPTTTVPPPETMATKIQKMAELSMKLNATEQEMLAEELKKLGVDFQ